MRLLQLLKVRAVLQAFLAVAFVAVFAQNALADKIKLSGDSNYRQGVGGEFNITAADAGGKAVLETVLPFYKIVNGTVMPTADGTRMGSGEGINGFETFCLEYNEFVTLGAVYDFTLDIGAVKGGVSGATYPYGPSGPKMDVVSLGTAHLYTLFASYALPNYDYTGSGRAADAEKLQKAIWYLEGERTLADLGYGATLNLGDNKFLDIAINTYGSTMTNDNNFWNVGVINLTSTSNGVTTYHQSQLIMRVPDGGLTAAMLGLALTVVAGLRRRPN